MQVFKVLPFRYLILSRKQLFAIDHSSAEGVFRGISDNCMVCLYHSIIAVSCTKFMHIIIKDFSQTDDQSILNKLLPTHVIFQILADKPALLVNDVWLHFKDDITSV